MAQSLDRMSQRSFAFTNALMEAFHDRIAVKPLPERLAIAFDLFAARPQRAGKIEDRRAFFSIIHCIGQAGLKPPLGNIQLGDLAALVEFNQGIALETEGKELDPATLKSGLRRILENDVRSFPAQL